MKILTLVAVFSAGLKNVMVNRHPLLEVRESRHLPQLHLPLQSPPLLQRIPPVPQGQGLL